MTEHSSADRQILAILKTLEKAAEDGGGLEVGEIAKVRAILKYGDTLVKIAAYEEAKGLFWAHWRSLILGAGAVVSALLLFWNSFERFLKSLAKVLQ